MKKLLLATLFLLTSPSFAMAQAVPTVTVTSPNGGESFKVGDIVHITWSSANMANNNVNIGYSYCAGCLEWVVNNIPNTGSYDWTIPVLNTTNTQYKIFIVPAVTGSAISDYSNNNFTIASAPPAPSIKPTVTVTSPNGGEAFNVGDKVHITWNSTNATRASIGYSTCSSCGATIVNDIPNTGSYDWVANVVAGAGSTAKTWVKIYVDVGTPNVGTAQDYSDNDFSIGPVTSPAPTPITVTTTPITINTTTSTMVPTISIISPSTNDVWLPGNTYSIKWNQQNISNIGRVALMHSGSEATNIFVTNLVTTLDPQTKEISFTVPSDLMLKTDSSRWPAVPILESNRYTIEIMGWKDTSQKTFYSGTFAIKKPSTVFHSASSSGIPTPYLLNSDPATDTSISLRLNVNPNGTENARVRFVVSEKNGTSILKTVLVPLPPINEMFSAATTITGLTPNTSYVLTTQAETDQVIVRPEFSSTINFTTKSGPAVSQSASTQPTSVATVVQPIAQITTTQVVTPIASKATLNTAVTSTGCTSTVGFGPTTGKSCATGDTVATQTTTVSPATTQSLTDQVGQDTQVQSGCVDLQFNLKYRSRDASTNGEVSDLQDFLIANGYLSGETTGYFGLMTVAAVKKFQVATLGATSTTPGYGGVGPKSRAKIKAMTCSVGA